MLGRDGVFLPPGPIALLERSVAGEDRVELAVGILELGLRCPGRANPVAALDLVLERQGLACELPGERLEPGQLGLEPVASLLFQAVKRLAEPRRILGERARIAELLGIDALLDLRGAVVGVDQTVDVPSEAQAELDVLDRDVAHRSNRAACPWPTPTQSVASP